MTDIETAKRRMIGSLRSRGVEISEEGFREQPMTFCELFTAINSSDEGRRQLADAQIRALTRDIAACWIEYLARRNGN